MNELALFAGVGGGILGGKLLGWRTVCAVERDAYAAQILAKRQNDGILEPFPIWSDVCSFDGKVWRGIVDVVSGGFPCQDISAAGKGAGIEGERSGMWKEMARIIGEVRPKYAFVENSPMLTTRGLGVVLADLASMGFDAEWGVLSAADVGAPHRRERIWILGHSNNNGQVAAKIRASINERGNYSQAWQKQTSQFAGSDKQYAQLESNSGYTKRELADTNVCRHQNGQTEIDTADTRLNAQRISGASSADLANTNGTQRKRVCKPIGVHEEYTNIGNPCWWEAEPNVGRVADGVAFTVDRLKAIGNGQVPLCAATAFELLRARFG